MHPSWNPIVLIINRDSVLHSLIGMKDPDKKANAAARIERQNYIVSAGMQTEIITDNACAIVAGFIMYVSSHFFYRD